MLDDVLGTELGTGLHVLVEKPLCTAVADCRRVLEASDGHRGLVWVGLEYRFMAPFARLIEEVRAGTAGRVRMASLREHRFPFLARSGPGIASPTTPAERSWRSAATSST